MTNLERYTWCRDKIKDQEIIQWSEWAEQMEVDVPVIMAGNDKLRYVQQRNSVKQSINLMAQNRSANWRLVIHSAGETIRKDVNSELINNDIPTRTKRIVQHMISAKTEINAFSGIDNLSANDMKYCRDMVSVLIGAASFIYGSIKNLKALTKDDKQRLLALVDMGADESIDKVNVS